VNYVEVLLCVKLQSAYCRVIAYLQDTRQTAANCSGTCRGSQSHTNGADSDSFDGFYPSHSTA